MRMVAFWPVGLSVILLPQSRGFEDGVLCLGVSDGGVVSDARVGVDVCVRADLALVSPALCEDELDVLLDCFEPISACVDASLDLVHELVGYIHQTKGGSITLLPLYQLLHYLF